MSVELLLNEDTEHSEKHDLESFFYVLLYICTMYSRPGTWNEGNIKDNSHPFGQWMDESNWYQIGAARNLEFSDTLRTQLLLQHVHSYFAPLIPMLEQLCDATCWKRADAPHGKYESLSFNSRWTDSLFI
jgi:hypothetical protein